VYKRESCAAFFLPRSDEDHEPWVAAALDRMGVAKRWATEEARYVEWAGFECETRVLDLADHRVLLLVFRQGDLLALIYDADGGLDEERRATVEQDGALALAEAFRDACGALSPAVAFIMTLPHVAETGLPDTEGFVADQASLVAAWDSDALVWRRYGLLYLGGDYASLVSDGPGRWDELPVDGGRLIFAGAGAGRWIG
jgi:hypothetical protein